MILTNVESGPSQMIIFSGKNKALFFCVLRKVFIIPLNLVICTIAKHLCLVNIYHRFLVRTHLIAHF